MFLKVKGRVNGDFTIIEVLACSFFRHPDPIATIKRTAVNYRGERHEIEENIPLNGTAYLLNHDGKTIETFAINQTDR